MKTIGIIGGITPDSTVKYYQYFTSWNRTGREGIHYPIVLIYSLDLLNWYRLLDKNDEDLVVECLIEGARALKRAGADFAIVAANTPHMYFERLQHESPIRLLSIVDATAKEASTRGYTRVGLLGTKFTMDRAFYPDVFSKYGIDIYVPDCKARDYINKMLFDEVSRGQYLISSKKRVIEISKKLRSEKDIDALILGCTELPLFLNESDVGMPVLDTVAVHANAALDLALK
jgi:aspartate racemase